MTVAEAKAAGLLTPKRRQKKPAPPPSFTSHKCVVLGIDPASTSGWSVFVDGTLVNSGVVEARHSGRQAPRAHSIQEVVRNVIYRSMGNQFGIIARPAVAVAETWTTGPGDYRATAAMMLGLGTSWGIWERELTSFAVTGDLYFSKRNIVRVNVATWRSKLFGKVNVSKAEAIRYVKDQFKIARPVGHDEAEAICIGYWGTRAGEVGVAIERLKKARFAPWSDLRRLTPAEKAALEVSDVLP
jgi:hypothetical protein